MRLFLVLLLVAIVSIPQSDAWGRRRRRFVRWRTVGTIAKIGARVLLGKRNVDNLDTNMDGTIDLSEAEALMDRRSAMELLSFSDENGDSSVSLEEFARSINNLEQ
ncbi:uncharacterized protein [Haliotis cracherodii]|uniref:uncharacterized protein n=1 Tax=Haliotis cracherodii TaxID=6455 RepID=UPI0039E8484B